MLLQRTIQDRNLPFNDNRYLRVSLAGISYEHPLTFSSPLVRTVNAISFGYNSTNLKLTANQIDTIQGISTAATVQFAKQALGMAVTDYLFQIHTTNATTKISAWSLNGMAHGATTIENTDVYGGISYGADVVGGLILRGLRTSGGEGLRLEGYGGYGTPAAGGIGLRAYLIDGTGKTDVAAGDQLVTVYNNDVSKFYIRNSGDTSTVGRYISTLADGGNSPLAVTSKVVCDNLNAEYWQGYHFADYLDQAVKQASSPTHVTVKLTGLTDGFIPYHVADATGLGDSVVYQANSKIGIGTGAVAPSTLLELYSTTNTALTISAYANGGGLTEVLFKTGYASGDVTPYAVKAAIGYDNASAAFRIALGTTITGSTNWALTATGMGVGTAAPVSLGEFSSATAPILTISAATAGDVDPELRFNHNSAVHASIGVDHSAGLLVLNYGAAGGIGGTTQFCMDSSGNIGLGVAASVAARLYMLPTVGAGTYYGEYVRVTQTTDNTAGAPVGLFFDVLVNVNLGQANSGTAYGMQGSAYNNSTGSLANLIGQQCTYGTANTGGITTYTKGINLTPYAFAGSTQAKLADIYINAVTGAGTITEEWSIYDAHAAPSYFVGQLKCGATTAGTIAQLGQLYVGGAGKAIGFYNQITACPATDAAATGYINYSGYLFANTQFRSLEIGNGKYTSVLFVDGANARVGIGSGLVAPAATLHSQGTTTQFIAAYSSTNFCSTTIDSGANCAFALTHSAGTPVFSFDHAVAIGATSVSAGNMIDIVSPTNTSAGIRLTPTTGTYLARIAISNTAGDAYIGRENNAGAQLLAGTAAYGFVISPEGNYPLYFGTNGTIRAEISGAGVINLTAATYAKTVGATYRPLYIDDAGNIGGQHA